MLAHPPLLHVFASKCRHHSLLTASVALCLCCSALAQSWQTQAAGTTASLRGISAVSARVAWASGTRGTYLITTDGGATWHAGRVPGAESLDFRAVHALDGRTAWLMSIGTGPVSRVYKTNDGGATWALQFTNPDAKGFFDCLAFWNPRHGIVAGDAVDGVLAVFATLDGGVHWQRAAHLPPALPGEGAFAASNSSLVVTGKHDAWIGTGAQLPQGARILHLTGSKFTASLTPIRSDRSSAGIFSLAFSDPRHAIAVGGDYAHPNEANQNIAVTADGGRSWRAPSHGPAGFRSAVAWLPARKAWIVTGTSGSDISFDGGETWKTFDTGNYNALGFAGDEGWAVGPNGRIARFKMN